MKRLVLLALAATLACDKHREPLSLPVPPPYSSSELLASDSDASEVSTETEEPSCPAYPSFDKTCSTDSDCALVFHTIDCCYTDVAWGIAASEVPAFDAIEAVCDDFGGLVCDCKPKPTKAEDDSTSEQQSAFAVACRDGSCTSYMAQPGSGAGVSGPLSGSLGSTM